MKKCSRRTPLGSCRHHFKHYRRSQFTEETAYFRIENGQRVPLNQEELEWLRKFQWDEISCNSRAQLNKEARREQDHSQHAKRNDIMNIALTDTPDTFIENVKNFSSENQAQLIQKERILQAIERNDCDAFIGTIEAIEDLDKKKALKLFEQTQRNKLKALAPPKKQWRKRYIRKKTK